MIFKRRIFLVFFPFMLFSETISSTRELASLQPEPSALVNGCVHAITGDFVFDQQDMTVKGAQEIVIPRKYISSLKYQTHSIEENLLPHRIGLCKSAHGFPFRPFECYLTEPNGMQIFYMSSENYTYVPAWGHHALGISGYCRDTVGNSYHPKNNVLYQTGGTSYCLVTSSGEKRFYKKYQATEDDKGMVSLFLRLERIQLSNNIALQYDYQKGHLHQIKAKAPSSGKTLSHVKFKDKDHSLIAEASDHSSLTYEFKKYKEKKSKQRLLKKIKGSLYPDEELNREHPSLRISSRHFANHRSIFCEYDERGRVTQLIGPQGILASIEYHPGETTSIDRDGNKTLYVYDRETLRLSEVRYFQGLDTLLKTEGYQWNPFGCLQQKKITSPSGDDLLTIDYEYNHRLDLIEKRIQGDQDYTYSYQYNDRNLLKEERGDNGNKVTYAYHCNTTLPEEVCRYKHDRLLKRTRYRYNDDCLLIEEVTDGEGPYVFVKTIERKREKPFFGMPEWITETCNDYLLQKTKLIYDKYGNVTKKQVYGTDGQLAYETETIYNDKGQVLSEVDAEGSKATYTYDDNGNLTEETTPLGLVITYDYDNANRLYRKTEKAGSQTLVTQYGDFDALDHPKLEIDPYGKEIKRGYDALGNLISETNSLGHTITYEVDALGNVLSITDPLYRKTTTTYNHYGSPLRITHPDGSVETYTYNPDGAKASYINEIGVTTHYTYDDFGNLACEEIEGEISRTWSYNAFRLLEETNLDGYTTKYTYDPFARKAEENHEGRVITYKYDQLSRLASKEIGSYQTQWTYDKLGRIISEKEYDGDLLLSLTETTYNTQGSPLTTTTYPQNHPATTACKYDALGRELQRTTPIGKQYTTSYQIESGHEERTTGEPGGITEIQIRNALGQLTSIERRSPENQPISRIEYTYYPDGNLHREETTIFEKSVAKSKHTIEYTYDLRKRKETVTESGLKTTCFEYYPDGKLKMIHKPDGIQVSHTYNALGHLTDLRSSKGDIHYQYKYSNQGDLLLAKDLIHQTQTKRIVDPHGQILEETLANGLKLKSRYDEQGRRTHLVLPNGETIKYTYLGPYLKSVEGEGYTHSYIYDLAGNLLQEVHLDGTTTEYSYDPEGQVTERKSPHLIETFAYNARGNPTQITENGIEKFYSYDFWDHLISETDHTYSYDSIHNRIQKDGIATIYTLLNQESHLEYDTNGNLLSKEGIHFEYDSLDRLTKILAPMGENHYIYDSEHRRVFEDDRPIVWDGQHEMGYVNYYRILGRTPYAEIGSSIAIVSWDQILQPLHNARGDLIKFLHPDIQMLPEQSFTAFGEGHTSVRWGYRSKIHEENSGLIYFGRRYYDPDLGRFITSDPEGYTDSANLHAYALNNPLTQHDPYGLFVSYLLSNEPLGFDPNRWKAVGTALGHAGLAYARETALAFGKYGGAVHGPEDMSFLELYQATNQARDRIHTASENWMNSSPYAGSVQYDWLRGMTYTGMDLAVGWWLPFGKVKTAGTALKTLNSAIKAEKIAHCSPSLLKTSLVTDKIFKSSKQSSHYAESVFQGHLLNTHLRQLEKYGANGCHRLSNGRIRYYSKVRPARMEGEMAGRRRIREWDPKTGLKRTWHETLDHNGKVRIVRPQTNDTNKVHYFFDDKGKFVEAR